MLKTQPLLRAKAHLLKNRKYNDVANLVTHEAEPKLLAMTRPAKLSNHNGKFLFGKCRQQPRHIRGQVAGKSHFFARHRVDEAEFFCVQGLAVEGGERCHCFLTQSFIYILAQAAGGGHTVGWVANQRIANMQKMHADLVSSARF